MCSTGALRGSARPTTTGSGRTAPASTGMSRATVERDDYFGSALTAGNFGRGTVADLAVGVRGESREPLIFEAGKIFHVGAVNVLYGDPRTGLRASDDQFLVAGERFAAQLSGRI